MCELMTKGDPVHQMAVYLFYFILIIIIGIEPPRYFPVEDNFIKDVIPQEERVPGSLHHFEMRSVFVPYLMKISFSISNILLTIN